MSVSTWQIQIEIKINVLPRFKIYFVLFKGLSII